MRKIVGIGLARTGTSTLGFCLKHWGLNHRACDEIAFDMWRNNQCDKLLTRAMEFDSFDDWPWPLVYKEIDKEFTGSKFILTRRKDPHVWFRSIQRHSKWTGPNDFRKYIFGFEMPHGHKKEYIDYYNQHLDSVRDYFRDRPDDFIEVCWEEGDGWNELSTFLEFECPTIPFPHINKTTNILDDTIDFVRRTFEKVL